MTDRRDDIVDNVARLINGVERSPYLFGSGYSSRIYKLLSRRAISLVFDNEHLP